jgi:tetratricopeptide (TPR) repeat protein
VPAPIDSNVTLAPASDHASAGGEGPSAATVTEAKQRFDRGLELYSEGEYSLALIEFNRAYELVPNYRVLYNIGQVGIQLAQYANARRALEEYLEKGGDGVVQERRESVLRDLDMLKQRTAHLLVTSNVAGAEILIDDVSVGKTPVAAPLLVDAGVHRVVAKHDGYVSHTDRVILAGGDEQTLAVTLNPQPEESQTIVVRERAPEEESHTLMIAGWVTTGALAAGAIVTGVMGASDAKQLEQLRSADPKDNPNLSSKLDSTKSSAKSLLLASDVLSGTALIVGGLSLWVTLSPSHPAQAPDADHPTPQASNKGGRPLQIGYQYGQVKLRGSF